MKDPLDPFSNLASDDWMINYAIVAGRSDLDLSYNPRKYITLIRPSLLDSWARKCPT
jgi:hypothetical protein